jgi:hypothetical protein
MPYARRDADGRILSLHRDPTVLGDVDLPATDPEVEAFLSRTAADGSGGDPSDFLRLDADFVRVIEDVIDTLIARNVINLTDLPAEAQAKLMQRKSFRERANRNALRLFAPGGPDDVV